MGLQQFSFLGYDYPIQFFPSFWLSAYIYSRVQLLGQKAWQYFLKLQKCEAKPALLFISFFLPEFIISVYILS